MEYLRLNISKPPTQAEIDWAAKKLRIATYVLTVVLVAVLGASVHLMVKGLVPFFGIYFALFAFAAFLAWTTQFSDFKPLAPDYCGRMVKACDATPESIAYRDAVIAQGRQFCGKELPLLEDWAEGAQSRKDCKTLYGVVRAE